MKFVLPLALLVLIASGTTAEAAPVVAAVKAVATWVAGLSAFSTAVLQLAVGTAMSLVAKAKMRRAQGSAGGIQTDVTLTGGTNSETFILGYYATAGTWICPPLTRGERNKFLTYAIDLAGLPDHTLEEVFVNGEKLVLNGEIEHGVTVSSVSTSFKGLVKLTYFNGSQTTAPQMMLDSYGSHPDYPWSVDMIGHGRCFAIVEFENNDKVFSGLPRMRFGMRGIPVFDPRDGSVKQTDNLALLTYAVLRGVTFPDGSRWGGEADLDDLPISVWASAMNEADRLVDKADGGREPQFRGGFEVKIGEVEPAEVLERFMDACTGDLAEEGGVWYVRVGAPPLPSAFLTDADLIVDAPMSLSPFASLSETQNGLTLKFPNPDAAWEVSESDRILRTDLEEQDEGRRLMADLSLSACPYALQVQRVGQAYIEDARRDVVHSVTLPPDFAHLPPLSVVAWTSDHNQYDAKQFSIEKKIVQVHDLLSAVEIREVDPADHSWSSEDELPVPFGVTAFTDPDAFILNDLAVTPIKIMDSEGQARQAAISVSNVPDLPGVEWRLRDSAGLRVADGIAMDVGDSFVISQGVLSAQTYFVGFRVADGGNVDWSQWYGVETDDVRIFPDLLDDEVWVAIHTDVAATAAQIYEDVNIETSPALNLLQRDLEVADLNSLEAMLQAFEVAEGFSRRLAYATQDLHARVDGTDEALATATTLLGAQIEDNTALIQIESEVRATENTALAQRVETLEVSTFDPTTGLGAIAASLSGVINSVENLDGELDVLSQSVDATLAEIEGDVSAQATTLQQHTGQITALGDDITAQAQSLTEVTTTLNGNTASIQQALTSLDGISSQYVLTASANGVVGGMVLAADAADGNAVINVAFAANAFSISSPDGAVTPFVVYSSPRTINGVTYPPGVYMENIYVGAGYLGEIQTGLIKSANYAENSHGEPIAGAKIDLANGSAKFSDVVLSRPLRVASGQFTVSGRYDGGHEWVFVNTNIQISANQVWDLAELVPMATAYITNGAQANGGFDPNNAFGGVSVEVIYGFRWNGYNNGIEPTRVWQKPHSPAVIPSWSTGTDQSVFLAIKVRSQGTVFFQNASVVWRVYFVT